MYRIVSEGKVVALCDEPRYVRKKVESGAYIQCDEADAEAVAVSGNLFSLKGKTPIEDRPEAMISKVDGGEFLFSNYVDKMNFSEENSTIEDALCEMDSGEY